MKSTYMIFAILALMTHAVGAQNKSFRGMQSSNAAIYASRPSLVQQRISVEQTLAYVVNTGSDNVSVINTTTLAQISTIPVNGAPYAVAMSPDGKRAYVTSSAARRLSVINALSNTVAATIDVGSNPLDVVVSPNGARVYVTNANSNSVSVINTATNNVVADIQVGTFPYGISINPDGSRLYVANRESNTVSVINTAANVVVATVEVGSGPQGLAISNDGRWIYTTNTGSGTVSAINTTSNTVDYTIPVGISPSMLAISADGEHLYVGGALSNMIIVINTMTHAIEAAFSLPVGSHPYAIAFSRAGSQLCVTQTGVDAMLVIDPSTGTGIGTVPVGSGPHGIALTVPLKQTRPVLRFAPISISTYAGNGLAGFADDSSLLAKFSGPVGVSSDNAGNIYVADAGNNRIRKINSNHLVGTIAGSGTNGYVDGSSTTAQFNTPFATASDHAGNLFVADRNNNSIRKIDPAGNVTTLAGDGTEGLENGPGLKARFSQPRGIALDSKGNIYVADYGNNLIREISLDGIVSTFAGSGQDMATDGVGEKASFFLPNSLAVDAQDNLYVTELYGPLRRISPFGLVTTIHTPGYPHYISPDLIVTAFPYDTFQDGIIIDACGNIYLSVIQNSVHNAVYKINLSGTAGVLAGGDYGYLDVIGPQAKFDSPAGLCTDSTGNLYVADAGNNRIRKAAPPQLQLNSYAGTASLPAYFQVDASNLVSDATLTAPAGFEISLLKTGGYNATVVVQGVVGEISGQVIFARLKGDNPGGKYAGDILLGAEGAVTRLLPITGMVIDTVPPVIQCAPMQLLCYSLTKNYSIPWISATDFSGIKSITYSISGATTRSGSGADASGLFNAGSSIITWVVKDHADNAATCSTIVRIDQPLGVSIPNVYPLPFFGKVNTIYMGFGPDCTILSASAVGGTRLAGNRYSYRWSTGATAALISVCPNATGKTVYTVTVTDSLGCTATASITIDVINARCGPNNKHVLLCWFGKYQLCYAPARAFKALLLGAKLGSCAEPSSIATTRTNEVNAPVGEIADIQLFPNPNHGAFELRLKRVEATEIRVTDAGGKIVFRKLSTGLKNETYVPVDLGDVSNGVYILQVLSKNAVYTSRFVVQR